jgi:hypothetical protein
MIRFQRGRSGTVKAQFNKNQRVWVECVGTWAVIEKIQPVWAKGFDEPVKITYEVGLGREFLAQELEADRSEEVEADVEMGGWRLLRAKNKWQSIEDCAHHPHPGSCPVVVTDPKDWGGWRVPGAEYDRDPEAIERQARLITAAPKLLQLAKELISHVAEQPDDAPPPMLALARQAAAILTSIRNLPPPSAADGPSLAPAEEEAA